MPLTLSLLSHLQLLCNVPLHPDSLRSLPILKLIVAINVTTFSFSFVFVFVTQKYSEFLPDLSTNPWPSRLLSMEMLLLFPQLFVFLIRHIQCAQFFLSIQIWKGEIF